MNQIGPALRRLRRPGRKQKWRALGWAPAAAALIVVAGWTVSPGPPARPSTTASRFTEAAAGSPGTANLVLSMNATPFITAGADTGRFSACFRVTNLGPETATNVRLEQRLPFFDVGGLSFATPSQGSCTERDGPGVSLTCSFGTLAPGESATVSGDESVELFVSNQEAVFRTFEAHASEPDSDDENNLAVATVIAIDCSTGVSGFCPVLARLASDICAGRLNRACEIPGDGGTAPGVSVDMSEGVRAVFKTVAEVVLGIDLDLFYRFRDEVLSRSPEGRRYVSLYETHGPEISQLLLANADLSADFGSTLQLWQETLRALVEGRGAQATISSEQISALQAVLEQIKVLGSPALSAAIQAEQTRLDIPSFAGGTIAQALTRFEQPGCPDPETTLCLQGGRFRATVSWRDSRGRTGVGRAVALTRDTGSFWFFSPDNVELVVKALDGRSVNGKFWIFYGALSNVEYTLTVTDTETENVRTYTNPLGNFGSAGDTSAFQGTGAIPTVSGSPPPPASRCGAGGTTLCLGSRRFEVSVTWRDSRGRSGVGQAVDLTSDSGHFWFFSPENVEVIVKVLDGRPITGRFWVFYGSLSNVEYTITVRDTWTGSVKTYTNPLGHFGSAGDTSAF